MIAQLQKETVQGPLEHPRFGKCLVVRPTIESVRAGRFPSQAVVVTSVARTLIGLAKEGEKIQGVVVEGGEHDPTKHPDFEQISLNIRELLNKHFPKATYVLLSDQPDLERASVRHALNFFDKPMLRFESGFQKTFTAINGEDAGNFKDIVEQMSRLESERLVLRARFVRGTIDNSKDNEVKAWLRYVSEIKPAAIEVSTLAKANGKTAMPITKTRMNQIVELVTEKTGIPIEVRED